MDNNKLVNEMVNVLINLKRFRLDNIIKIDKLTHSQKLVLFILYDLSNNESKVSLTELRKKIGLAPSTITPIITSLEDLELIERNIDKNDRRNIYLELSSKGIEYTNKAHDSIHSVLEEYIKYMGEDDIKQLIKLITKTSNYFEERRIIDEKSI